MKNNLLFLAIIYLGILTQSFNCSLWKSSFEVEHLQHAKRLLAMTNFFPSQQTTPTTSLPKTENPGQTPILAEKSRSTSAGLSTQKSSLSKNTDETDTVELVKIKPHYYVQPIVKTAFAESKRVELVKIKPHYYVKPDVQKAFAQSLKNFKKGEQTQVLAEKAQKTSNTPTTQKSLSGKGEAEKVELVQIKPHYYVKPEVQRAFAKSKENSKPVKLVRIIQNYSVKPEVRKAFTESLKNSKRATN
jgi:hypothetical protein